ncbi:MAG: DUF99 family protein [Candidatus Micrarchaeales archaeon]
MKEGIRILAIACSPLKRKKTLLVGLVSRKDYIEGLISTYVTVDGIDSTNKIAKMLKESKFNDQVRLVVMNGIGIAGLNVLDVKKFEKLTSTKVLSITRRKPRPDELIKALKVFSSMTKTDVKERIMLVEKLNELNTFGIQEFYLQTSLSKADSKKFVLKAFELVRLAHLIASGIESGESKGRI